MRDLAQLKQQLRQLGIAKMHLQRYEVAMLADMLGDDETVEAAVFGVYDSGYGMLAATSRRLLMIKHSFMRTNCDDIAYHHITDIKLNTHLWKNEVMVCTRANKELHFKWLNRRQLFRFARAVEQRVHAAQNLETTTPINALNSPAPS